MIKTLDITRKRDFFVQEPVLVLHKFLLDRIELPWSVDFRALGRVVDGKLVGVVGYEGFNGHSCRMHMAGDPGWMTREFIRKAFRYPFVILDMPMVFAVVPSGNTRALAIDKRLGFKELMYLDGAHPDGGLHFLQLKREDWTRTKHGREITKAT